MAEPRASQPYWPDYPIKDVKLLPWSWALDKLTASRNYYISTVRPDGEPHTAIVWAVWIDGALYFSTGGKTRKARNLAHQPRCTIATDRAEDAVILEGVGEACAMPPSLPEVYKAKYDWELTSEETAGPFFGVRPRVVFAFRETDMAQTTRWTFDINEISSMPARCTTEAPMAERKTVPPRRALADAGRLPETRAPRRRGRPPRSTA